MKKFPQVKEGSETYQPKKGHYWNFWRVILAGAILNGAFYTFIWQFIKIPFFIILGAILITIVEYAHVIPGVLLLGLAWFGMWIYNVTR